jgi:hypothetical protein
VQSRHLPVWLTLAATLAAVGVGALFALALSETEVSDWWRALAWGCAVGGFLIFLLLLVPRLGRPFIAAATWYRTRKLTRLTGDARYRQILRCPLGHQFEETVRPTSEGYLPDEGTEWDMEEANRGRRWFVCPECGCDDVMTSLSLKPFNESARKREKLLRRWPFFLGRMARLTPFVRHG